ncbi:Ig-like domain-containing protein [Sphingomicrobium sp. XHP0239]|uniref:Ig-like domain-containing protein n=1 Tax=Sphingomicrobium maritimum TaxID=3133972 RepID=UPI0031CC667F
MTDAVGSIDTSNADSGAEAADTVETTETATATETQAPAPSQAEIAAQAAALAAASVAAAEAEAVVEGDVEAEDEADEKTAKKEDKDEDEKSDAEDEDVAAETLAEVEAIVDAAAAQDMDDDDDGYYDDDDDTVSPFLAVGLTALIIGGGVLLLSSDDDDDDLDVIDINIPPIAQDTSITVDEDADVSGRVTAVDPDDTPTFTLVGTAPAGLTFNSDGTFTFDADQPGYQDLDDGETRTLSVDFVASDGTGSSTGTLTIVINGVTDNAAPVAVDDTAVTDEDTDVTIDVLANDTDADADDDLIVTAATVPAAQGTVEINDDGTITFSPADDFNGTATITYTVSDGTVTDTGTVTVTVNPVNDAPDVTGVIDADTDEDTAVEIDILGNVVDADGDDLTIVSADSDNGTVVINDDGTITFTPDADFNGDAVINFTVSDGTDTTDGSLTVTVDPVADAPLAVDDTANTDEDNDVTVDVLANDSDGDGDDLTVTSATVDPAQGTVEINEDGTLTFSPAADFNGTATITYTVSDGELTDTATLTVTVDPVADAPIAVDDTANTDEDTDVTVDVLANDSDGDGDDLTVTSATVDPAQGTVVINEDGTLTFSPAADFNGTATITYTVSDGELTDTATLTVTVDPVVDALDAIDDVYAATEDSGVVTGDVTANDVDADGGDVMVMLADGSVLPPAFTLNADGTWSLDTSAPAYQSLAAGETQTYTFDYVLSDADGGDDDSDSDTATVTLTVTGVNDAPTANADTANADFESAVTIDVLANDTDPDDDDDLTVTAATSDDGTVVINDDGTITFTPNDGFEGDAVIDYTISDGNGGTASSTATVTVAADPDPFDFISLDVDDDNDNATRFAIREDGAVTGAVLDADDGAFNFTDDQDLQNNVSVLNFGDNDTITFNADPSDVAFASGDFDGDGLADDVEIAVNIGGVVSQVFLLDAVAPGSIVFDETTAEAAIGADTNNFLFGDELPETDNSGGPGEGTSTPASADQDDDGDTNTQFLLTEDGDDGAFDFTDDSTVANNVAIDNFGDDDTLTFLVDDPSDVAFASGDFDGDGQADDLQIAINLNGVVSEIVLLNSVEDGAIIFNEQQAEDAIGPGTENFIFDTGSGDAAVAPMADETLFLG